MKYYNKLVRDNIPQFIRANGKTATTSILNDRDFLYKLHES